MSKLEETSSLVLTMKVGHEDDEIVIGNDEMRIRLVAIRAGQVRVSIHAPRFIPVNRASIFERIKNNPQEPVIKNVFKTLRQYFRGES